MSDELTLWELAAELRRSLGILHKRDIQTAADRLGALVGSTHQEPIRLGDDCAAIPDGEGYLLLAAEGMWPTLVDTDPWFAGWCAVITVRRIQSSIAARESFAGSGASWRPRNAAIGAE